MIPTESIDRLVAAIRDGNDEVRGTAWQNAGPAGAPAIPHLASLMVNPNFEVMRSARRAIQRIVRHAGRPGAETEARAVEKELIALLGVDAAPATAPVRREALWWLSEIGSEAAVAPMSTLLGDPDTREDARCALMRLPGDAVSGALRKALATAPEPFRFALAESLRQRGEVVEGYPSQKLTPTKRTAVG